MNPDHYALVFALYNYPRLKNGGLNGPQNDADAVCGWLKSPNGGGLPPDNVRCITSKEFMERDPGRPVPTPDQLTDLGFEWIYEMAENNREAGLGFKVGTRIYFYLSGHGFAAADRGGCLLTANAAEGRVDTNIGISNWFNWWRNAACFDEYIVLLDACMNRLATAVPSPAPRKQMHLHDTPGPTFFAYAAKAPKKTVEKPLPQPDKPYHGIFTWCLLEGLTGAAANNANVVTGASLGNWLSNSMYHWFSQADVNDIDVCLEPDIVTADADLVLATNVERKKYQIELVLPNVVVGQTLRIWSGRQPEVTSQVAQETNRLDLEVGLHLAECEGFRQGFEVVRPGRIVVSKEGPKVLVPPPGRRFLVRLDAGNTGNQVMLQNADLDQVARPGGHVEVTLPFGLYRARIRAGRRFVDHVFLLDGDYALVDSMMRPESVPPIASAVPFNGAPRSHEQQSILVGELASNEVPNEGSQVAVVARGWTPEDTGYSIATPWKDIRILGADGKTVGDVSRSGVKTPGGGDLDGSAYFTANVSPGTYFLRFPYPRIGTVEMSLVTVPNWRTEVYLLRSRTSASGPEALPRRTFIMRRQHQPWRHEQNERLEKALIALADGRSIMNAELNELLLQKFASPIEGIVGAHLLLIEHARDQTVDLRQLDVVVTNLRGLLGGRHPDVEALALMCTDRNLCPKVPFDTPPMFERSWRLMVEASRSDPALIPLRLWSRVAAQVVMPPYFAWTINAGARSQYKDALLEAALMADLSRILDQPKDKSFPGLEGFERLELPTFEMPAAINFDRLARDDEAGAQEAERVLADRVPVRAGSRDVGSPPTSLDAEARARFAETYWLPPTAVSSLLMSRPSKQIVEYAKDPAGRAVAVDLTGQEYAGEMTVKEELSADTNGDEH